MKIAILFVLALACLANGYMNRFDVNVVKNDKDLLEKQKFVLDILHHVYQPLQITEYLVHGRMFVDVETEYKNWVKVVDFIELYKTKLLPKGHVFSVTNERQLREVKGLFDLFYYAKDWTVFRKNVIWARMHVNEDMFVHAVIAAVIHRDDMVGVMIPSPYEIMPHKFITGNVINEGIKMKLQKRIVDDTYVIWENVTGLWDVGMNRESILNYFTHDIGWNTYYYFTHLDINFWMGDKTNLNVEDRIGERYWYVHQQLLARYNLERVANDLGDIIDIDWVNPIQTGYFTNLRYFNGVNFPMRHNNYLIRSLTKRDKLIDIVKDYERRLRDVIDMGYIVIEDKRIDLHDPKSVDVLGRLLTGNLITKDKMFLRYLEIFAKLLLGGSMHTLNDHKAVPSVLENYETALRDPVFYQLYKRLLRIYWQLKDNFKVYTKDQLLFKGVKIENIRVSKLVTFFDYFDIDITNAIDVTSIVKTDTVYDDKMNIMWDDKVHRTLTNDNVDRLYKDKFGRLVVDKVDTLYKNINVVKDVKNFREVNTDWKDDSINNLKYTNVDTFWKSIAKVRRLRLNHEPFSLNLDVTSDKDQKVVIRMFLGPKYDVYGRMMKLDDNRVNFVELDRFVWDVKAGKNIIKRTSRDFIYSIDDGTTYSDLYKHVMTTTKDNIGLMGVNVFDKYNGMPDRLLLPRGKVGGLRLQLFVIVTPITGTNVVDKDNVVERRGLWDKGTTALVDDLPLGYPFDRRIDYDTLFTFDNMFFKDVLIFHREDDVRMNYVI